MGAVLWSRGSDSVVRQCDFKFTAISASISPPKVLRSGPIIFNFASKIGRDRFNFASKIGKISLKSCVELRGFDSTMEEPRSRLDRAAIVVRSDRDRGVLLRILSAV